jgi:hypothetical protein
MSSASVIQDHPARGKRARVPPGRS